MNTSFLFKTLFRIDVIGFALCIAFFLLWPRFDLTISQLFYDNNAQAFYYEQHSITNFIYSFTSVIAKSILIGIPVLILFSYILKNDALIKRRRILVFLISSCILGPGLLVNLTLKDNWERPRPYQTINFKGKEQFEPPFQPKFECDTCFSFVSGHASVGFYFFVVALLTRKKRWLLLPIALGSVIGGTRILQGGHFFSDVIFSGWVVWFSSLFLYYLFFNGRKINWL